MNRINPIVLCCALALAGAAIGQSSTGAVRWRDHSGSRNMWSATSVALGDHGAAAAVARNFDDKAVPIYTGTDSVPAFTLASQFDSTTVAAAAEDTLVVRTYTRYDAAAGKITAAVEAYESYGAGAPLWIYNYPFHNTTVPIAPFLFVSRDGQLVVATWGDFAAKKTVVESFRRDGTPVASTVITPTPNRLGWWPLTADASDDARIVGLHLGNYVLVVDAVAGKIEFSSPRFSGGATRLAHSISVSGDATRLAYGKRVPGEAIVLERAMQWAEVMHLTYGDVYIDNIDLNADGRRLGLVVQDRSHTAFDTRLYDVPSGRQLFSHTTAAPQSQYQLYANWLEVDDAGDTVAVISWGDSQRLTPEIQCFDEAGNTVYAQKTPAYLLGGSALAMDLSPDGKVMLVGSSSKHQNIFSGGGGDIFYIDVEPPGLSIMGMPRAPQTLDITPIPPVGALASALAVGLLRTPQPLPAPFQDWRLDATAVLLPVATGQTLSLGVPPASLGVALHWQVASVTARGGFATSTAITTRFVQ